MTVQGPSRRARLRYGFDNVMARGSSAMLALLGVAIIAVVVVFSLALLAAGIGPPRPITVAYDVLLKVVGTSPADEPGAAAAVAFLVVTLVGILIFGAFIGTLVTGMDARLERLRQGRSLVLERDHTLILGWSERVFKIVAELVIANESRERPSVVILAERPKAEMEDAIRERVHDRRNTRVVCRTGNPVVAADLELVNHCDARAVIVLGSDDDDAPDADVIKTLLALTRGDGARGGSDRHIVAEIQDAASAQAAALLDSDAIELVNKPETIGRLIVQTSRQSGAAAVYREILDFAGFEIYMRRDDELTGRTVRDAALGYRDCTLLGLMHGGGEIRLNPPPDAIIAADDTIIALAEDDSELERARYDRAPTDSSAIVVRAPHAPAPEQTLLLGYNRRTPIVLAELASYARPGSNALVVGDVPLDELTQARAARGLSIAVLTADTTDRAVLEDLDIAGYDRVIVMSPTDHLPVKRAAARSLLTLLHVRDIVGAGRRGPTIISEILDPQDADLVRTAGVDDIVVSDDVVSLLLTQVAENRHLAGVFRQLFQAAGAEVYLRPVEDYVGSPPVSFATLVEAAGRRHETALGYWLAPERADGDAKRGMRISPPKDCEFTPSPGDRLIVLAEE